MAQWHRQVEELLYEGESIRETVDTGEAGVVVTTHRVLAFTPQREGANFRQVDRPNVEGVDTGAQAETQHLERAGKAGVIGAVLLGAGWFLDFGSLLGDVSLTGAASTEQIPLGSVMGPLQSMLNVLEQLDDYMLMGGALALLLAVLLVGVYWWQRDRTLVISVAGDDDVHLTRPANPTDAASRLERAIAPRPTDDGSEPSPSGNDREHRGLVDQNDASPTEASKHHRNGGDPLAERDTLDDPGTDPFGET